MLEQKIQEYIDLLKEVDTKGVEPLTHVLERENVFREDEVTNIDQREKMLANAPQSKEGMFVVPKTIG